MSPVSMHVTMQHFANFTQNLEMCIPKLEKSRNHNIFPSFSIFFTHLCDILCNFGAFSCKSQSKTGQLFFCFSKVAKPIATLLATIIKQSLKDIRVVFFLHIVFYVADNISIACHEVDWPLRSAAEAHDSAILLETLFIFFSSSPSDGRFEGCLLIY